MILQFYRLSSLKQKLTMKLFFNRKRLSFMQKENINLLKIFIRRNDIDNVKYSTCP